MGGSDEAGQGETGTSTDDPPKKDGEEQLSEAASSALATFRAAVAEVQYLSGAAASNPEADAEAMAAAKTKLAMAMRAATLAGVSEAVLIEASAPPEEEEEEGEEEATKEEAEKQETVKEEAVKEEPLKIGDSVEIFGLESEGGKLLNSQAGSISGYLEDKGRFQVTLAPDKIVSVRPENLRRRKAAPGSQSVEFQAGDRVEVFGLESEAARKHNGEAGKILRFQADKGRFQIELDNKEMISVRPANLTLVERGEKRSASSSGSGSSSSSRPAKKSKKSAANPEEALERMLKGETRKSDQVKKSARDEGAAAAAAAAAQAENEPLKLGERVEVFGLRSETGKAFNGKTGLITKWDNVKARFQVDLFMGTLQSLKPENLRRVAKNSVPTSNQSGDPCSQFQDSYSGSTAGYTLL